MAEFGQGVGIVMHWELESSQPSTLLTINRVPYEHAHGHNFKLMFLGQESCLLNHAQVSGLQYQFIPIFTYHQYDWLLGLQNSLIGLNWPHNKNLQPN